MDQNNITNNSIEIFIDGACKGNPGPGGWGVLIRFNGKTKTLSGKEPETTNNRMELTAAIEALQCLKHDGLLINIYTDSKYVCQGMTEWIKKWKVNNWRTSDKTLVKNKDLWEKLDVLVSNHNITWHWIKGHAGHTENEIVDALANQACCKTFN